MKYRFWKFVERVLWRIDASIHEWIEYAMWKQGYKAFGARWR